MRLFLLLALCEIALGAAVPGKSETIAERPTEVVVEEKPSATKDVPPQSTETNAEAKARFEYWNKLTSKAWDENFYTKKTTIKPERSKRAIGDYEHWLAADFWGNGLGYSWATVQSGCSNNATHDHLGGLIVKSIHEKDSNGVVNNHWWNGTWRNYPKEGATSKCVLYNGTGWPCSDYIWNPTTQTSEFRGWNNNDNLYWTTNNASYNGHTVRTIHDCKLGFTAVEYNTTVTEIGAKPIQYTMDGLKYFRWYDSNGFAWFAARYPPGSGLKQKRQGLHRNSNPIWDFGAPLQRYWNSDMTPFPTSLITNYNPQKVYTVVLWPQDDGTVIFNDGDIMIEGERYMLMASSRPGLRHWTAKMIITSPIAYPSILNEQGWGYAWVGYRKWAQSHNDANSYEWYITP